MDDSLKDQIQAMNRQLEKEVEQWQQQIGMTPEQCITVNTYLLDVYLNSLVKFLVEKELIVDEEITLYFKTELLDRMSSLREEIVPEIQRQRREGMGLHIAQSIPKGKLNG